jgi:DNA polymerase-3 subunit epsilon
VFWSDPGLNVRVVSAVPAGVFLQPSFDELDEPLRDTTFTVVDLETTGGTAGSD